MFAALHVYLIAIIAETAHNVPGGMLDCRYLDNLFRDLSAGHPQCCGGNARARELEGVMTLPFESARISPKRLNRRSFIGGSDARVIMGSDEAALLRLWHEKRGEAEPEDLSDSLIVQLGLVTEPLNRHWFERNTGHVITQVQRRVEHQ